MMSPWFYLIIAGLFEVGWPLGFKLAHTVGVQRFAFILFAVICMGLSGYFLYIAQKHLPIGTAYVVWTSIGALGTFFIGVIFFGDSTSLARFLGVALILSGVITLKLTS